MCSHIHCCTVVSLSQPSWTDLTHRPPGTGLPSRQHGGTTGRYLTGSDKGTDYSIIRVKSNW